MSRTKLKLISGEPNPEGDWHVILSTSWWRGKVHFEPLQCHCRGQNFLMTLHYLMKYRKLYTSLFRSSCYREVTSINLLCTKQMLGNDTWTQKELHYQSKCLSLLTVPKWVYLSFLWDWAFTVKIQLHRFNCISENHFICLLQRELASAVVLMKLILSTLSKQERCTEFPSPLSVWDRTLSKPTRLGGEACLV